MLNSLDLNRLKIFYYIYRNNSVIGAAKELNVTPSAVSQHLKKLENELQIHLFTRMHRRLVPTLEAEKLFSHLEHFFTQLEIELKQFKHGKNEPAGMLRIGAPVEFGKAYFPQILSKFSEKYSEVDFSLTLGNSEKLLKMIRKGELDFTITDLFESQKKYMNDLGIYAIEPILNEEIILVCSQQYFSRNFTEQISLDALLQCEYISYDRENIALRGWFKHHFGKQTLRVRTILTVDSVQAVLAAIENNMGLGIITCHAAGNRIKEGSLVPIRTNQNEIVNKISIIQLQDKIPNLAEKIFQQFLKDTLFRDFSGADYEK